MGQKVNPLSFRLGVLYTWTSRWFADKKRYRHLLLEDVLLREKITQKLKNAGLAKVDIDRSINKIDITVYVTRPGVVIGRGGQGLEELKKFITSILHKGQQLSQKQAFKIELKVEPVKEPNLDATIVANMIADQLVKRFPHRRAVNQAIDRVMSAGAKGVKIQLSGRIAGAEISRREKYQRGTVPLSTLRQDVDFAKKPSLTKSGYIGVKVWICKGEKT